MQDQPIYGYGLCECGCGEKAPIAKQTNSQRGYRKGEPKRFIQGHAGRMFPTWIVDAGGCWIWQGFRGNLGYGKVKVDGRQLFAHNWVWERYRGPVPEGTELDHLCRNRPCVNPAHLQPVTHAENCRRGRQSKLTWVEVREIRRRVAQGEMRRALAEEFKVSKVTIHNIVHGHRWGVG